MKNKKINKKQLITIAGVAAAAVALIVLATALYKRHSLLNGIETASASVEELSAYSYYSGSIAPINSADVLPSVDRVKVSEVLVSVGDEVEEGQVLMRLDSSEAESELLLKEAQVGQDSEKNALNYQDAKQQYEYAKSNLENNKNLEVQAALATLTEANANYINAITLYNQEQALAAANLSDSLLDSYTATTTAYTTLENAQKSYQKYLETEKNPDATTLSNLEQAVNSSRTAYQNACLSFEAAKLKEDNTLSQKLWDTLMAQLRFVNAMDAYNNTLLHATQELQKLKTAMDLAELGLDGSIGDLELQEKERQLNKYEVLAPIAGEVTSVVASVGTTTSDTKALCTVTDFSRLKIDIKIGEYDIEKVEEGQPVIITLESGAEYPGTFTHIDSTVSTSETGVNYFKAVVVFDEDEDVKCGITAQVKIARFEAATGIAVPNEMIYTAEDGTEYVTMREGSKIVRHPVVTGVQTDGTYTLIEEGLSEGDEVVRLPMPEGEDSADLMKALRENAGTDEEDY